MPNFSMALFFIRICLICYILLNIVALKKTFSKSMKLIFLFVIWVLIVSILREASVISALRGLSIPILVALYLDSKRNNEYVYRIIGLWSDILFCFVVIDLITMIVFPIGMYRDSLYTLNWFLGYKTARLVFSLPLCIFQAVYSMKKYNRLTLKSYICFALSIYTLFKAQATSGSVTMIITCLIIVLIGLERNSIKFKKFWYYFFNYKIIISVYGVITFLTIYMQNSPLLQYFIVNILKKDATLTTRTTIWESCIYVLKTNPITGLGYLSIDQYQNLTNNIYATSAHNMTLTILISGGAIGIVLYIAIIISAWNRGTSLMLVNAQIISMGIIALLIIGVTSSSVLFSLCGFVFFILMEIDVSQNQGKKRSANDECI